LCTKQDEFLTKCGEVRTLREQIDRLKAEQGQEVQRMRILYQDAQRHVTTLQNERKGKDQEIAQANKTIRNLTAQLNAVRQ
jgi:predicted  nucleic acid-binding Zn-ribbon protein